MEALPYVYLLVHTPSRKLYIGSRKPKSANDLWVSYFSSSKVIKSMPTDEFVPIVLSEHNTEQEAREAEAQLHDKYQVHKDDRFLNQATARQKFYTNGAQTPEHRSKISEALKGKKKSAETRRKMSEAKKGKKKSAEHRQNISEALKGNKNAKKSK
jgi:hypothetical protein